MPIPTIFFSNILTRGFNRHFVRGRYTIGGPIGWNVVSFGSLLCSLPYSNNLFYLCFPFLGEWYTYSRSHIRCGSYVKTIAWKVINIRVFNVANKVCSLVSSRIGPLYIISFWFFYFWLGFSYFGCTNEIHIICWISCGWGFT